MNNTEIRSILEELERLPPNDQIKAGANNYNDSMYVASENGHIDIVRLLLRAGANLTGIRDAIEIAEDNGHFNIVNLLRRYTKQSKTR